MRKLIALALFVAGITILVTIPNLQSIAKSKQIISEEFENINTKEISAIQQIDIAEITCNIQNALNEYAIKKNNLVMSTGKYNALESYELLLDLEGEYDNICNFSKELSQIEGGQIIEIHIAAKDAPYEGLSHNAAIKVLFVGAPQ